MKSTLFALSLLCLVVASGCGSLKSRYVYKIVGGRSLPLTVDYPPHWKPTDKRPGIVFFYGGSWSVPNLDQFKPQSEYFAKRGIVCVRADFRLLPRDGIRPDQCVEDALSAMRWLRGHASELGLDPERLVAAGASSGGHLAACTFFCDGDNPVSAKPDAMILYNPVLDLVAVRSNIGAALLAGLDEATLRRISPSYHICKETPPTLIIDGAADTLNAQIRDFVERSRSVGAPVEACYAEGQPHAFFNNSPWLEKTTEQADEFLCRIGFLEMEPRVPLPSRSAGPR